MRRYINILVPIDGTGASEYALRQACAIARTNGSHVLAVIPFISMQERNAVYDDISAGINAVSIEEGVPVEVMAQQGRPSNSVIDAAEKKANDLIVLGKMDMNALEQMVIKSFTGRIIGHSTCDILVIPDNVPLKWDSILLCADGSKQSETAADNAVSYAAANHGSLTAIAVVDVNEEFATEAPERVDGMIEKARQILDNFQAKAQSSGVKAEVYIREGETHAKILELAREKDADIIIMGSHARTGVSRILMGSVAEKVISSAPCPVLVVKAIEL